MGGVRARPMRQAGRLVRCGLLALSVTACTAMRDRQPDPTPIGQPDGVSAGDSGSMLAGGMLVDGRQRTFHIHRPAGVSDSPNIGAILVLHGAGQTDPSAVRQLLDFHTIARNAGLWVVYPAGLTGQWNDGRGVPANPEAGVPDANDSAFLAALAERLVRIHRLHPGRIFLAGVSSGGAMALRAVCDSGHRFAAAASVSGGLAQRLMGRCNPVRPIPVMLINGTDDPVVPFDGGPFRWRGATRGEMAAARQVLVLFAQRNGCAPGQFSVQLPDVAPDDGSVARIDSYQNCPASAEVSLITVRGGGHPPPAPRDLGLRPEVFGRQNRDFDAAEAVWAFFSRHGPEGRRAAGGGL